MMIRSLLAGAVYFLIVFAAAFGLGVLRVSFVTPAVGPIWATAIELPFTLGVSWLVCGWVRERLDARSLAQGFMMGASAFALLMVAEAAGAMLLFGRSLGEHISSYATAPGALGLAGQVAFALFPVVQYRLSAR